MLFDHHLNLEFQLNRIIKLIKSLDKNKILEINSISQNISKAIRRYLKDHSRQVHPQKVTFLTLIKTEFDLLKQEKDLIKINNLLKTIFQLYERYNFFPATYLLRHPEKFDATHTGPSSSGERSLTKCGVKQAKEFSDFLVDEMLIANKPVELIINFSYYKRTRLFAEIIRLKAEWMRSHYDKNIKISFSVDDRLAGDLIKTIGKNLKDLEDWLKTKNASDVSTFTKNWFSGKVPIPPNYTIYVGVTHLPNLASFLVYYLNLGAGKAIKFKSADYIKFENARYCYDKEWF